MKKILLVLMAMFAFGWQNVNAQDEPIKIQTGNPDIKLNVTKCVASDRTVIIDMVLTNESDNDIDNIRIEGGVYGSGATAAYDDLGNTYKENIRVKIGNQKYSEYYAISKLVSGIPIKISFMFENVSPSAQYFALIEVHVSANGNTFAKLKIRNVPITRE